MRDWSIEPTRSILHSPPRHSKHHSRQESAIAKQRINSPLTCSNACLHNLAAQDWNNEIIKIRTPKSPTEDQDTKVELTQVPATISDKIATKKILHRSQTFIRNTAADVSLLLRGTISLDSQCQIPDTYTRPTSPKPHTIMSTPLCLESRDVTKQSGPSVMQG